MFYDIFERVMWLRQPNARFEGFRYKLDSFGRYVEAIQMLFSHGYSSPLFKKADVAESELIEVRLKPG